MGAERRTPCLIGRDGERAEIARFLDRVGDLPAALVLRGEMGAGKTTLLDDVVQQALARSYRVLRAAPAEPERDLSFGVLRDLFDQAFELVADRLPAPQRTALAVALLREEPGEGYHGAAAVAASTLSALRALSMLGPVLLVIDDAQWMDRATADVLGFALRRLRAEPVGLALVQRLSGDEPLPSPLDGWPAERTVLLSIGPLSMGAVHVLLLEHLGISLPRPLLRRVHSTSGGNPFFALEIGRVLASGAPPLDEPLPMPVTLRGLLRQRLSALPTAVREVLAVASAMTRPTVAAIEELVGGSAAELLEEAADAGILAVDDERVRFTHPLLAAQAYAEIPPAARRRLHRRLVATATDPVDRARHLALAVSGPDPEVAAALEHAASAAARRGVPRMAGDLAERAADLTPRGGDAEAGRRRLQAARFHFLAGDTERARDILTALVEGSPPGGVRSEALATLGRIHLFTDDLDRAAALLAEAVAGAGGSDRLRAEVEEGLAWTAILSRGDVRAARAHARRAVRGSERTGDRLRRAEALAAEALAACLLGGRSWRDLLERAEALAAVDEYPRVLQHPTWAAATALLWTEELEPGVERLEALRREAIARGDEESLPRIFLALSYAHALAGRPAEATALAREGSEIALQSGQRAQVGVLLFSAAVADAWLGIEASADLGAEGSAGGHVPGPTDVAWMVGRLARGARALSLGDPEEADRQLAPLTERVERAGIVEPGAKRFVTDHVESLIALGRTTDAEALLAPFEGAARRLHRSSALLAAVRCQGLLRCAAGATDEAERVLSGALERLGPAAFPVERGRTLLALGTCLRRAARKRGARTALDEAAVVLEEAGARAWAERARDEARRIGGRVPTGELTATERRVAQLVAEGRSNREVAAALFVSVKAVEATLSKVYAKLGVPSRTALVRLLASSPDGATGRPEP